MIDRVKLGAIVFNDSKKRRRLDKISHPRIYRRILVTIFKLKFIEKKPLVVIDAPLLFETKLLEYFVYPILVVYCDNT
jgi:dephospho-CoA kinase